MGRDYLDCRLMVEMRNSGFEIRFGGNGWFLMDVIWYDKLLA